MKNFQISGESVNLFQSEPTFKSSADSYIVVKWVCNFIIIQTGKFKQASSLIFLAKRKIVTESNPKTSVLPFQEESASV